MGNPLRSMIKSCNDIDLAPVMQVRPSIPTFVSLSSCILSYVGMQDAVSFVSIYLGKGTMQWKWD
jgi:hypothetical protein